MCSWIVSLHLPSLVGSFNTSLYNALTHSPCFNINNMNSPNPSFEGPQGDAEGSFDFKDWLQSRLRDHGDEERIGKLNGSEDDFLRTLREVSENYGKKRLFVCCDGTWLNASGTVAPLSNVAKLARSVDRDGYDPLEFNPNLGYTVGGVPQLVYYTSGVGTRSTLSMDSSIAAATGKGISHVIRDAYCFLSNNYNGRSNKDEIILVGFSRGAFTVRCLAKFISDVGLLRRSALPFLPVLYEDWVNNDEESLYQRLKGAEDQFYENVKIKVLAEWDPVDTLGVPYIYPSRLERRMKARIVPKQVENAFLALSLGEKRKTYWPTVWKEKETGTTTVSQCAFLGDHGDVGGGHPDPGLSTISLLWMVSKIRGACKADFQMYALLQFNTPILDRSFQLVPFRKRQVIVRNLANTKGTVHQSSFWWFLPHYLTLRMLFNGRRRSVVRNLAARACYRNDGCNLEVHPTVRLLNQTRKFSTGPLHNLNVVPESQHGYKWTLKGDTHLPIYEQSMSEYEKKLLENWKVEALIWEKGSTLRPRDSLDDDRLRNWLNEWEGITKNPAWGFAVDGHFKESLIKEVCDGLCG
ncbi:hypothetical protein KVR01_013011 [Diaporthe batatas]|uniref:uncharacterized protein n=1 Tax=Diaporthe batatas TaxID=748121 RepID=UPI001D049038|nr:uncharacterized protein KVR01_013011 [Diaporthe batatas]KAG8157021.1 hypothetical protein KVR01_013011 [Diaporthe batatas]